MTSRHCHVTFDMKIYEDMDRINYRVKDRYLKTLEDENQRIINSGFVDYDEAGKELWIIQFEMDSSTIEEKYVILTKNEGPSMDTLPVSDAIADRNKLVQFKSENGWHY